MRKAIVLSTVLAAVSIPALEAADLAARDLTPLKDLVVSKGETVAVGNGNARGLDSFKDVSSHPLYKGKAVVVLRRDKGAKGPVTLTASVPGLKTGQVAF